MDLCEEAFEGCEAPAEGTWGEVEVEFGAGEGAGFGFEDVSCEVVGVGDVEGYADSVGGNGATGFDFVGFIYEGWLVLVYMDGCRRVEGNLTSTVLANGAHYDDFLEVRNVYKLHVCAARPGATWASRRECMDFVSLDITCIILSLLLSCGFSSSRAFTTRGIMRTRIRQSQSLVLLWCPQVIHPLPLPPLILKLGFDPTIPRRIIEDDREWDWEFLVFIICFCCRSFTILRCRTETGFDSGDESFDLCVAFGVGVETNGLVGGEVLGDGGEEAFDVCEVAALGGDFEVEFWDAGDAGFGFDELAVQVRCVCEVEGVFCSALLDLSCLCGLQLRSSEFVILNLRVIKQNKKIY